MVFETSNLLIVMVLHCTIEGNEVPKSNLYGGFTVPEDVFMEIEACEKNGYRLVRIKENLTPDTDLVKFKELVSTQLEDEISNLALSFTEESYFYSRTIAILIQFMGIVKERNGSFAIIHPNSKMLEMIQLIGLEKFIETHTSEEALGSAS